MRSAEGRTRRTTASAWTAYTRLLVNSPRTCAARSWALAIRLHNFTTAHYAFSTTSRPHTQFSTNFTASHNTSLHFFTTSPPHSLATHAGDRRAPDASSHTDALLSDARLQVAAHPPPTARCTVTTRAGGAAMPELVAQCGCDGPTAHEGTPRALLNGICRAPAAAC